MFDPASRITGILPMHPELNRNKMSITVDLHHEDGQALVKKLASTSDAVVENYAAGALSRWGLDYEGIRSVKPDIVYMSMPGWGSTGPFASHVLFGLAGADGLRCHPSVGASGVATIPPMRCLLCRLLCRRTGRFHASDGPLPPTQDGTGSAHRGLTG